MTSEAVPLDRRQRRRQETIEEVLDHAIEIMADEGVAGLSLGEIARRMGFRPPSLYVYFPSKHALYDALFKRGWELLLEDLRTFEQDHPPDGSDLATALAGFGRRFARWSVQHPAYAQLLFWRPVPGFRPSDEAYRPAIRLSDDGRAQLRVLQERGLIRPEADLDRMHRQWTIVISGVVSQQLANAPDEPFDHGLFTTEIAELATMFADHYADRRGSRATTSTPRRRKNASKG
jgi:AcrR family transcriptional regulator